MWIYILTNQRHTTLYTGVTNNLERRIDEHRSSQVPGFTRKYNLTKLIYAEEAPDPYTAISREKQIKNWRREKKIRLIEKLNPDWKELIP